MPFRCELISTLVGLLHPLMQRLRNAADLLCDRYHRRPAGGVIALVICHHPHHPLANFRCKLIRCLAHTGSTFSGVGASGKPGAVHRPTSTPARFRRSRSIRLPAYRNSRCSSSLRRMVARSAVGPRRQIVDAPPAVLRAWACLRSTAVLAVDRRFALSRPALPSAPDKKIVCERQLADLRMQRLHVQWRRARIRLRLRPEHTGGVQHTGGSVPSNRSRSRRFFVPVRDSRFAKWVRMVETATPRSDAISSKVRPAASARQSSVWAWLRP